MTPRPWFRKTNYEEALKKWESGKWPTKTALARHLGVERAGMVRILRIAKEERCRG